ncbi:unnamed protein product [Allacma fusca]|uniref:Uncharacterized protein n=1 Tax=Allacma fusca TaxID=39272 RepID=A0A8J2JCZ6_9HEXA|nr:unnamed protein product [Allacma fusca]
MSFKINVFEDKMALVSMQDEGQIDASSNPEQDLDALDSLELKLVQITICEVPKDPKELPDKKLLKIISRLFRKASDVDISNRIETGMVQIKYREDLEAQNDLDFVLHSYGWRLIDESQLLWRFRLVRRNACNPNFPLVTDSFKISYLPPDIRRTTLRYLFPHVRSIAISNKRVRNRLIDCLRFNIAEAVLKFRDPYDANENYEHAKNLFMDMIPVRVVDEHQGKLLIRQRAVTITNIPEKVIADCILAVFENPCDITGVQIHKSPDKAVGSTAKVWFWSHSKAIDSLECQCLSTIAPLWLEWILPHEIKISEINPDVTNKDITKSTKEMLGRNIHIKFLRRQKSIIIGFKSTKAAKHGFKYLTKQLKWSCRNERHVLSEFTPPQDAGDVQNKILEPIEI